MEEKMEETIYLLERKCINAFKKLDILNAVKYDKLIKELKQNGKYKKNEINCK